MNTQKYNSGNSGLLRETDRSMYKKKDVVSHSLIDKEKTHLNYNLCSHPQYTKDQITQLQEKIRKKKMPKNGVFFGSTIITLPKDYKGDTQEFFRVAYEEMKKMYNLKEEDIVSAYVHMDESTPHMHFYFIPVARKEKESISWDDVVPRKVYRTQHKILSGEMSKALQCEVNLLNGETLGKDVSHMTAEERKASLELEKKKKEVEQAKEELITVEMAKQEEKVELNSLTQENALLKQENLMLREENRNLISYIKGVLNPYINTLESVYKRIEGLSRIKIPEAIKKANRVFGKRNISVEKSIEVLEARKIPEEILTRDVQEGAMEGEAFYEEMEESVDEMEF